MSGEKRNGINLGIAFQSKRMGYVLGTENGTLVDYGIVDFKQDEIGKLLCRFSELMEQYKPDLVCFPDIEDSECRLGETACSLIKRLYMECEKSSVGTARIAKRQVGKALGLEARATKHEAAAKLADIYYAFAGSVPPPRKLWESQHRSMCVFAALGLMHVQIQEDFSE